MSESTDIVKDIESNAQVYENLRGQLEKEHWGEWAIIVSQQLAAVAPTLEEADRLAEEKFPDAQIRLVRKVGQELPKEVWKL